MIGQQKILDAHIHYQPGITPEELIEIMDSTGTDRASLVLVPHRQRLSSVPEALMLKDRYPERFFVYTSFDVSEYYRHGKSIGRHMAKFVDRMRACGCDGLKIIEGKPQMRKMLPVPDFDLPCWEPFWEYAEESELPILWHVNDPETFWDIDAIPAFAKEKGWFYDESFINNEKQYLQIYNVLSRHPKLKIIFAHFFFMSAQLNRLSALLDTYPNIMVDITPGIELYENLSADIEKARAFFAKYGDRIVYGTDIGARTVLITGSGALDRDECLRRAQLVQAFLLEKEDIPVYADGNFLIGTEDFTLRALGLDSDAAAKIFEKNFLAFTACEPRPVMPKLVLKECRRLKTVLKFMSLFDREADKKPDMTAVEDYFKSKLNT